VDSLAQQLNPDQLSAVAHPGGPALVVAGPGSGKTRVLAHRFAYLVQEKGVPSENILAVTFTNKAAGEMRERVAKLLTTNHQPLTTKLVWLGTFHAICARLLRREFRHAGLSPHFVIYDESDTLAAIRQALQKLSLPPSKFSPVGIAAVISQAKNELLDAAGFAPYAQGFFQEKAGQVFFAYEKILARNHALDFDDLLLRTVRLLEGHPAVLKKYQQLFREILIDEYQDTNHAQYALTKLLAANHQQLFVVGDMAQAIYSFRGADFRNILNFEKDYPQAAIYHLGQNYRSTQTIVRAAKNLIEHNLGHLPLELTTQNEGGEKIKVYEARDETDEAEYIVNQILNTTRPSLNTHLGNFAILYRTNAQSRPLEEVLLKQGVPYTLIGGTRFYERKEIKDMLSFLRLLQNPKDSVSGERPEKMGKRRATAYQKWVAQLRQKKPNIADEETSLDLLDRILNFTHYLAELADGTEEGETRGENVKELRSVAERFPNLNDFLENVALIQQEFLPNGHPTNEPNNPERVTLMTLHAAKGLEFPVIFIVGLEEGLFPHSRSLYSKEELEEERRLCYVGLSRAKKTLYLTFARGRLYFGRHQSNLPSRFLGEIPPELLEFGTTTHFSHADPDAKMHPWED
jgi:DNA helicase-2/ATP-dependent DNA helicase PcrA